MKLCYRKAYTKAKEQLQKGEEFLHHTMKIMDMQPWKYVGFVCFPNMENREDLTRAGVVNDEDELKVLINKTKYLRLRLYDKVNKQSKVILQSS